MNIQKQAYLLQKILKPYSRKIDIAGSIRRQKSKVNDIDIVLIPTNKVKIRTILAKRGKIKASGEKQIFTNIKGIETDVFFATPHDYGAQLLTRTGSAGHNIGLRMIAKRKGLLLNQYGLFKSSKRIAGKTEQSIFKALGKQYKEPKFRF